MLPKVCPGPSGGVAEGADEGGFAVDLGDEPGVGKVGLAFEVEDVGGFEVAVDEVLGRGGGRGSGAVGLDAAKFALAVAVFVEVLAVDDFEGAVFTGEGAGEPDLTVAAFADGAQEGVVSDCRLEI